MYSQRQAIESHKKANKATYQNVWTYFYGNNDCTRDEAKANVYAYAKEKGVRAGELFDMYNDAMKDAVSELLVEGYFDF